MVHAEVGDDVAEAVHATWRPRRPTGSSARPDETHGLRGRRPSGRGGGRCGRRSSRRRSGTRCGGWIRYRVTASSPSGGRRQGRRTSGRRTRRQVQQRTAGIEHQLVDGRASRRRRIGPRVVDLLPGRAYDDPAASRRASCSRRLRSTGPGRAARCSAMRSSWKASARGLVSSPSEQVEHRVDPRVAPVPAAVGDEALVGGQHDLVAGAGGELVRRRPEHRLDRGQHHERPLQAAAQVEQAPRRAAHRALHGQPGQGAQRRRRPGPTCRPAAPASTRSPSSTCHVVDDRNPRTALAARRSWSSCSATPPGPTSAAARTSGRSRRPARRAPRPRSAPADRPQAGASPRRPTTSERSSRPGSCCERASTARARRATPSARSAWRPSQ